MRWLFLALLMLLAVASLFAGLLLTTEWGARWVWSVAHAQVMDALPDTKLEAEVGGRLIGPLFIEELAYHTPTVSVRVGRVELDWQPSQLLDAVVHVSALQLQDVVVALHSASSPEEAQPSGGVDITYPDLPVDVVVEQLLLNKAEITVNEASDAIVIDQLRLAAQLNSEAAVISELQVTGPQLQAELVAELVNQPKLPFSLNLGFAGDFPEMPRLQGEVSTRGNLSEVELKLSLQGPYNLFLQGTVTEPLRAQKVDLQAELQAADFGWLHATLIDQPLNANLQASYQDQRLEVEALSVDMAEAAIVAAGVIDLATRTVDVGGGWQNLRWPLIDRQQTPPGFISDQGKFNLSGSLDRYTFDLGGDVMMLSELLAEQARGPLTLRAEGTAEQLTVEEFAFGILGGSLTGQADLDWSSDLNIKLEITGADLNPGEFDAAYPGDLDLQVQADVVMTEGGIAGQLHELRLDGRLRGEPLRGTLSGVFTQDLFDVSVMDFSYANSSITGAGGLGQAASFDWHFEVADLGAWSQEIQGAASAKGRVSGSMHDPQIELRLAMTELVLAQLPGEKFDFDIHLAGMTAGHELRLTGTSSWGDIAVAASGAWADQHYALDLSDLVVPLPDYESLRLDQPVVGVFSAEAASLDKLCLNSANAQLCAAFSIGQDVQTLSFDLQRVPLGLLAPPLPPDLLIEGSITGTGTLADWQRTGHDQHGEVALNIDGLAVKHNGEKRIEDLLSFAPGTLKVVLSAAESTLVADLPLREAGGVYLNGTMSNDHELLVERSVTGEARIELPSIAVFDQLSREVESLAGELSSTFELSGSFSEPRLLGGARLAAGQVEIPEMGIDLTNINLELEMPTVSSVNLQGGLGSGAGDLTLRGSFEDIFTHLSGELALKGDKFEVLHNDIAHVLISPDVNATLSDDEIKLHGKVLLPLARIELDEVPQSAVKPSGDQILIDEQNLAEQDPALRVFADLEIELGEEVSFTGLGLAAQFSGAMSITERPSEVTTANGEITITEGSYKAYGQDLDVQDGKLIWVGGPLADPGINILAMRQPKPDMKVGVRARGTLSKPRMSLTSTPAMTESDQLAYLILGRPLEGSSAAEGSYLNKAALALGIKGGNYLTERYGEKLGVDQIGIETAPGEDQEKAALVIGKYLSPKLYVSYGLGLLDSISTLRLEYSLNRNWSLKTESSAEQSSGDLSYTIEVD